MTIKVFVPNDTSACSLGADEVAAVLRVGAATRGIDIELVRNGSRGAYWLEPLVEVQTAAGRIGFGPVRVQDVASLLDAGLAVDSHPLALGRIADLPWLARQQRLSFRRVGEIDPLSIADYRAHDGLIALGKALELSAQQIVDALKASGLRGRGGAAFPAGIKWQTVLDAPSTQKYIV